MRWTLALMAVVSLTGCATPAGTYPTFSRQTVDAPSNAPSGLDVDVAFDGAGYVVTVGNSTDASVLFRWDLASFISTDGISGFLIPGSTRMMEVNQAPRSEPIPPGGRMARLGVTVWEGEIADATGLIGVNFEAECSEIVGRPIRLVLPIEAGGEVLEYMAEFEVEHVLMVTHQYSRVRKRECPEGG